VSYLKNEKKKVSKREIKRKEREEKVPIGSG